MSCVSEAYDWGAGGGEAVGGEDGRLEGGEGFLGERFRGGVAGNCYVYYGARRDRRWKEDGGKFDLVESWESVVVGYGH